MRASLILLESAMISLPIYGLIVFSCLLSMEVLHKLYLHSINLYFHKHIIFEYIDLITLEIIQVLLFVIHFI